MAVIAATGDADMDFRRICYRQPTMIMLGDERDGLTPGQVKSSTTLAKIPMKGSIDSLNVAMAGTLLLYEAHRQRYPPPSAAEAAALSSGER